MRQHELIPSNLSSVQLWLSIALDQIATALLTRATVPGRPVTVIAAPRHAASLVGRQRRALECQSLRPSAQCRSPTSPPPTGCSSGSRRSASPCRYAAAGQRSQRYRKGRAHTRERAGYASGYACGTEGAPDYNRRPRARAASMRTESCAPFLLAPR